MLGDGVQATYSAEICPDWCDEAVIAITKNGDIRVVIGYGDQ
jgi:hypothetical protein